MRQVQTDGHRVTLSNNDCSDCRLLEAASRNVPQCRMDMKRRLKRSRSAKRIFRDVRQSQNKRFIRLKCIQKKLRFWFSRCEPKACVSAECILQFCRYLLELILTRRSGSSCRSSLYHVTVGCGRPDVRQCSRSRWPVNSVTSRGRTLTLAARATRTEIAILCG